MNIITSNNLTTVAAPVYQANSNAASLPGSGEAGPSSRAPPLESLKNSFSDNSNDSMFAKAKEMQNSGASENDIRNFIENEVANNSDDQSNDSGRTGRLIDILV